MRKNNHLIFLLFLITFCALLYGYKMGSVGLSDPDETFYAETAKEMLNYRSFITPLIFDKPQFEKPPMFYWLIMLVSLAIGMNEFAVRFVPALFGIIGVIAIYFLANSMFNRKTAIYASLILSTNFIYLGLSRCALTDIVFTAFVLLSLTFFYFGYKEINRRRINLCLFFLFCALAVLTKGPLGILIPIFAILPFLALSGDLKFLKQIPWFWGISVFAIVALPWYVAVTLKHPEFLKSFFFHENIERFFIAEHKSANTWYFYPAVLLGSTFPWSILFPFMFVSKEQAFKKEQLFLKCWFWAPLIFFTAAQSKLSSYILPMYPALCLILARALSRLDEVSVENSKLKLGKIISSLMALVFLSAFVVSLFFVKKSFPELFKLHILLVITICCGIILAVILLWKNRFGHLVAVKAAAVFVFVTLVMSNIWIAEGAFSDKDLVGIINQQGANLKEEILCSKIYVRGVYFYSEKNVVVINDSKRAFFRPHPIRVISESDETKDFFKTQKSILCVVNEEHLERINSLTPHRVNEVIYKNFDRYVVLSKPSK